MHQIDEVVVPTEWFQLSWAGTPVEGATLMVKELVQLLHCGVNCGQAPQPCRCDNQAVASCLFQPHECPGGVSSEAGLAESTCKVYHSGPKKYVEYLNLLHI